RVVELRPLNAVPRLLQEVPKLLCFGCSDLLQEGGNLLVGGVLLTRLDPGNRGGAERHPLGQLALSHPRPFPKESEISPNRSFMSLLPTVHRPAPDHVECLLI